MRKQREELMERKGEKAPIRPKLDLFLLDLRSHGADLDFFIPTQLIKIDEKSIVKKSIANAKEIDK